MPLPKPNTDETHDDFISRCMANPTMNDDFPDQAQRFAVCQSQWDSAKKEAPGVKHMAPVLEIKADAATPGMFSGYASVFNNVDMFGEKVLPGAFVDSLVARKRPNGRTGVKMFWSHNPSEPIGKWLELSEDQHGLAAKGQLNLDVQRAKEIHALMLDDSIDGMSIGYREVETDFKDGVVLLQKLDLLEISVVSMPANPKSLVETVKSENRASQFDKFCTALREGKPLPVKDFEDLLREAGVPRSMATAIASVGYAKAIRSESEGRQEEALTALRQSLASFKL